MRFEAPGQEHLDTTWPRYLPHRQPALRNDPLGLASHVEYNDDSLLLQHQSFGQRPAEHTETIGNVSTVGLNERCHANAAATMQYVRIAPHTCCTYSRSFLIMAVVHCIALQTLWRASELARSSTA